MPNHHVTRRRFLEGAAATACSAGLFSAVPGGAEEKSSPPKPKSVAAIITEYRPGSHADVLVGKILAGWKQDGGPGPALKLASMYVDQFPDKDLARPMAEKYKVPICDTIEQALTLGGKGIAVDGVLSIGEHGDYPTNDKGQKLYPRRRFFKGIADAFEKHSRVVPVFSDKHLGPVWADALWMYERAKELKIPFMAGSSLPLSFRDPELSIPLDCEIEGAVGVGYSGLDIYGFHSLECFQCLIERRKGGERGVKWVECLQGTAMWDVIDRGLVRKDALAAALAVLPRHKDKDFRLDKNCALFRFQYADGFLGSVLMLPDFVGVISVGVKIKGQPRPVATRFEERPQPYPHFAYLLKAIERMIHIGRVSYPLERTLLTSGILDRALTSLADGQKRLMTPELAIEYMPVDYPHAPAPELEGEPK